MYSDLIFDSRRHLYFVNSVNYPSVSSIVESFAPKFNPSPEMMAACVRKYNRENRENITEHQLVHKWQTINKKACDLGHETHDFLEHFTGHQIPKTPQEEAGIKYIRSLAGKFSITFRELRAYSKEYGYAGTMDLPLQVVGKNQFVVADYKTNGDLFKSYDYLYSPFEYLESNPYNKYQIQLSLYQIMLEEAGLEIVDRQLVYLMANGEFKTYSLYDFTGVLRDYLKKHKPKSIWSLQ